MCAINQMFDKGAPSQPLNPKSWNESTVMTEWAVHRTTSIETQNQTPTRPSHKGCQVRTSILLHAVFVTSSLCRKAKCYMFCKPQIRPRSRSVAHVFIPNVFHPTFTPGGGGGDAKAAEQSTWLSDVFFYLLLWIVKCKLIHHSNVWLQIQNLLHLCMYLWIVLLVCESVCPYSQPV